MASPGGRARRRPTLGAFLAVLVVVALTFGACGDGDSNNGTSGTTASTAATATTGAPAKTGVTASAACAASFKRGHEDEKGGRPTSQSFLPSIRACHSLEEWTSAERAFGVNLQGREAEFVDNTCTAAPADVQSSRICSEAKAALNPPGRPGQ
jgi:hypothetical protein